MTTCTKKQITAIASAFRKAQKRGYKGTLAAWLQVQCPSYTAELEEAVAKKVASYEAQAAAYAAR